MIKLNVYTAKGIKKGSTSLPKDLVEKENLYLLAQALRVYESRLHPIRGSTKTRGEVRASGAKIWRQKGTGRARHGDIAAPIFVGGGIAHGPRVVKRKLSLPRKMRQKALKVAITLKAKEGRLTIVEDISSLKKTSDAQRLITRIVEKQLNTEEKTKVSVIVSRKKEGIKNYFRNIENTQVLNFEDLNAREVFQGGFLIVDSDILKVKL